MDNKHYQNELNQVYWTAQGRQMLADALTETAVPARRTGGRRRWIAAALAAAVLAGTAAAAAQPLWSWYFGDLDNSQQALIDTLRQDLPPVESNGTTMTPLSAFGDEDFYYLLLEITVPETVDLPRLENAEGYCHSHDGEGYYQLSCGTDALTLTAADGSELACTPAWSWKDSDPNDHTITAAVHLNGGGVVQFNEGSDKLLHIPGLWIQSPDKTYTALVTGSWDFNIGGHVGDSQSRELDVTGVRTEHDSCGTLAMERLRISSLGIHWRYSWNRPQEGIVPGAELAIVMRDGKRIGLNSDMGSLEDNWCDSIASFETPIDVSQIDSIQWGDAVMPMG